MALLTVAFSVGQAIGPLVSGLLSDSAGGISEGLWLSVVLLAVSAGIALVQREHRAAHRHQDISKPAPAEQSSADR
ncbi:MAG: YbfB/YjiJ family MFS transporter [Actinoallomurus sp.]